MKRRHTPTRHAKVRHTPAALFHLLATVRDEKPKSTAICQILLDGPGAIFLDQTPEDPAVVLEVAISPLARTYAVLEQHELEALITALASMRRPTTRKVNGSF